MSQQQLTKSILARSHDRAENDNRPYHFCAKNEYIAGRFLAGGCGSRQRQVADGADVVFTDTPHE